MDLREIQLQIEDNINSGTRALEEVHRETAGTVFAELGKIDTITESIDNIRVAHDTAVSSLYEFIRNVNTVGGQTARDIIERFDG